MTAISGLLKTIPLLSMLTPVQLSAVSAIAERCAFTPGETVVVAGAQADCAYYVLDGQIECVTTDQDGNTILTPIPSGAVLLELAMIVELDVSATCVARGPAKALRIPRHLMHDVMQDDIAMTDKIIEALTVRLRDMADTMREASLPFEPLRQSA